MDLTAGCPSQPGDGQKSVSYCPEQVLFLRTYQNKAGCRKVEYALLRELYMWDKLPLYIHK
jgi:hypothetical protein